MSEYELLGQHGSVKPTEKSTKREPKVLYKDVYVTTTSRWKKDNLGGHVDKVKLPDGPNWELVSTCSDGNSGVHYTWRKRVDI